MEEITKNLLKWYKENKRELPWRKTKDAYHIWISEIMLQQTRVEAVKEYYKRFTEKLPTLKDLASIEEDNLLKLWEGLGYYSRVRNMQKTAKILIEKKQKNLPNTYEELISLPGIGEYTAGAILSIAFNQAVPAIDGNVYRVLGRYYGIAENISKQSTKKIYEKYINNILPTKNAGDFTQSFMDLGSAICTPKKPRCFECPLKRNCKAHRTQREEFFPVKEKKAKQSIEERIIFIFHYNNKYAIQKRPNKGLLASMYEFPNILQKNNAKQIKNYLKEKKINYKEIRKVGSSKHIFSHKIWLMQGYIIDLEEQDNRFTWKKYKDLVEYYSIPSTFSYYMNYLKEIEEKNQ